MLDANKLIAESKAHMQKAIDHLEVELTKIRAGRANPSMLDMIQVDYYGTNTPLAQVASISTPDARSLAIQPWEKSMIKPIESFYRKFGGRQTPYFALTKARGLVGRLGRLKSAMRRS